MMKKIKKRKIEPVSKHKVMRELYRNYMQFREYVRSTGETTIEYQNVAISFYDLGMGLNELSPRKKHGILFKCYFR